MSFFDRFLAFLLYALALVMVAGAVHIVAILLMPYVAPNDGFARLSGYGRPGELVLLPRIEPGHQLTPFADPALAQGICLFDLDDGSLFIHGDLQTGGLVTLSFRTRTGRIFYGMTDKASQHGTLAVRVLTGAQREKLQGDEEQDPQQELRIVSPEATGYILINAFVPFPSARSQSEAQIKAISCATEPMEDTANEEEGLRVFAARGAGHEDGAAEGAKSAKRDE
jgi:uncharacterized membrane protein